MPEKKSNPVLAEVLAEAGIFGDGGKQDKRSAPRDKSHLRRPKDATRPAAEYSPEDVSALHGDREPNRFKKSESPRDRLMCILKAQGLSNREIARQLDVGEATVSNTLRQPWAREHILQLLNEEGRDAVSSILSGAVEDSVYTLIAIRDDPNAGKRTNLAAAESILNRVLGKPVQKIESVNTHLQGFNPEKADQEIDTLQKRIAHLQGEKKA